MVGKLIGFFFDIPRLYKRLVTVLVDIIFIIIAIYSSFVIRVENMEGYWSTDLKSSFFITLILTIFIFIRLGLYRAVIRYIDTKALTSIFLGALASGITLVMSVYFFKADIPRSIPFIYAALLLIFVGGSRLLVRGLIHTQGDKGKIPILIYGAGSAGQQLALSLQHGCEYYPIAFIDDNKEQQRLLVAGLKVFEPIKLGSLIEKHQVQTLLLAMPSITYKERKNLLNRLESFAVEVLTIPGSADLVSGKLQIDTFRKINIADLLGREAVKPIERLFRRCLENKHVMVTGAGGSIGSELCRQIVRQKPLTLVLLDSSEFALYTIENELLELLTILGRSFKIIPILASVQDKAHLSQVIKKLSINTIYHAAAYKHVPIVEYNTVSGIRNNVWGTMHCAEAAIENQVENFVLISTDKAVRPTNIMGATKRLAELVLQALACTSHQDSTNVPTITSHQTNFSMVRFGNVLGSSGSVVPLFKKQIEAGGPITITHPDINRYFMTIPEAAQLVIQAGAMGLGGEVYVLDMGLPVKINDLANKMVHLSGLTIKNEIQPDGDIEICYSGLRPGEKLYEELLIGDNVEGTEHKRIMKAIETSISWKDLNALLSLLDYALKNRDIARAREILIEAPLGFKPSSEIVDFMLDTSNNKAGLSSVVKIKG